MMVLMVALPMLAAPSPMAYMLINLQEMDKCEAPLPQYPLPVLFLAFREQKGQGSLSAFHCLEVFGHRRMKLSASRQILLWSGFSYEKGDKSLELRLLEMERDWKIRELSMLRLAENTSWLAFDYSYVLKDGNGTLFIVNPALKDGEHFARALLGDKVMDIKDFHWDNVLIAPSPRKSLFYNFSFHVRHNAMLKALVAYARGFSYVVEQYPSDLLDKLMQSNGQNRDYAVFHVNDANGKVMELIRFGQDRPNILYSISPSDSRWHSLEKEAFNKTSTAWPWLMLSKQIDPKERYGEDTIITEDDKVSTRLSKFTSIERCGETIYTGENSFYSLPDLQFRFRWNTDPEWELLTIDGETMLYRIRDELWCAEITLSGIRGERLLVRSEYLRGVHWAVKMGEDGFGTSPPCDVKLYPAPRPGRLPFDGYYVTTPPPQLPESRERPKPRAEVIVPPPPPPDFPPQPGVRRSRYWLERHQRENAPAQP